MVAVIVPCVLLVVNPDRSAGSRVFASALLCASSVAGAVMGGCIVSLAFLARGGAEPLMSYLPEQLRKVGSFPQATIAQLQDRLAQHAVTALPPALLEQVRARM